MEGTATIAEMAAIKFDAWKSVDEAWRTRSNVQWRELFADRVPAVIIAVALLYKSKEELIDLFAKVDIETSDSMMSVIFDGAEFFKEVSFLMEAAQARLLGTGSAFVMREESKN